MGRNTSQIELMSPPAKTQGESPAYPPLQLQISSDSAGIPAAASAGIPATASAGIPATASADTTATASAGVPAAGSDVK